MKRNTSIFSLTLTLLTLVNLIPSFVVGQQRSESATKELLNKQEKVYVQLDKPYYYAGEKLWFKAYMNYRSPEMIDSLSKLLYIELISPDKTIIQTRYVLLDAGSGDGYFSLPDSISSGSYILRAYTLWMLNYPEEEIFIKNIPLLNEYERPVASATKTEVPVSEITVRMRTHNEFYKAQERINIQLQVRDKSGSPRFAELSVSITDVQQVVDLPDRNTILNQFEFFSQEPSFNKKGNAEPDRGINFTGLYKNKKGQPAKSEFFVTEETTGKLLSVQSDKDGKFKIEGLMFYDSSNLIFQTPGKKKKFEGDIEISERLIPSFTKLKFAPPIHTLKESSPQRLKQLDTNVNEEAIGKVIMEEEQPAVAPPINKQVILSSYGKPDFSISGEEIVKSSRTSLMDALMGRVPGLTVFNGYLRLGGPSNFQGPSTTEPMLIIDGAQFSSGGNDSNYGRLKQINPEVVERVDVIKYGSAAIYGSRGGNGVIIVTTKKTDDLTTGASASKKDEYSLYKPVIGFSNVEPFQSPDYSKISNKESIEDNRSTIFWSPYSVTDNLGNATISFYAADKATTYKVVVEGVTANGEPLFNIFYLNIIK